MVCFDCLAWLGRFWLKLTTFLMLLASMLCLGLSIYLMYFRKKDVDEEESTVDMKEYQRLAIKLLNITGGFMLAIGLLGLLGSLRCQTPECRKRMLFPFFLMNLFLLVIAVYMTSAGVTLKDESLLRDFLNGQCTAKRLDCHKDEATGELRPPQQLVDSVHWVYQWIAVVGGATSILMAMNMVATFLVATASPEDEEPLREQTIGLPTWTGRQTHWAESNRL